MSIIESVKSDNDSFAEQDSGGYFIGSVKTNSINPGRKSEENSFIENANDHFRRSKFVSSKNVFSFNSSGTVFLWVALFPSLLVLYYAPSDLLVYSFLRIPAGLLAQKPLSKRRREE